MENTPEKSLKQINTRVTELCYRRLGAIAYLYDTSPSTLCSELLEGATSIPETQGEAENTHRIRRINPRVSRPAYERLNELAVSYKSLPSLTACIIESYANDAANENPTINQLLELQDRRARSR